MSGPLLPVKLPNGGLPCQACHASGQWYLRSLLAAPRPVTQKIGKAKKKRKSQHTRFSLYSLSLSFCHFPSRSLHPSLLSLLLSKVFPVAAPKSNCSKLCQPDRHFDIFPRLQKSTTTIGLWLRGTAEVAKAILVITSLCLYVRWHGSQTFTAGWRRRVWFWGGFFQEEADLLVVSQAACSMPRDIFLVCDWLFPTPVQVNIRACAVSTLKMVACLPYVNGNVEVYL